MHGFDHRGVGRLSATAGICALALAGCAEPVPQAEAQPAALAPVLTEAQETRILAAVTQTLDAADASGDPAGLDARLTGPALFVRRSQLEAAAIADDNSQVTHIPDSFQQIIVPTTVTWPRTMYAITDIGEELAPPRLLALEQSSPREDYKLWAWVPLMPGVQMPALAHPLVGTPELAPNDSSLKVTPADALNQYADLLTLGSESSFAGNFEPADDDAFRVYLDRWRSSQEQALEGDRVRGTYSLTVQPLPDTAIKSIRTVTPEGVDDGALVVAALILNERLEAMEGAILTPQTQTAKALLDGQTFTNILTATYTDMIALYVPPAGSSEPIRLLGYMHAQTGASVADPEPAESEDENADESAVETATEPADQNPDEDTEENPTGD